MLFHLAENNKNSQIELQKLRFLKKFCFLLCNFFRIEEVKKRKWAKIDENGIK